MQLGSTRYGKNSFQTRRGLSRNPMVIQPLYLRILPKLPFALPGAFLTLLFVLLAFVSNSALSSASASEDSISVGYTAPSISIVASGNDGANLNLYITPDGTGRISSGTVSASVTATGAVSGYNLSILTSAMNGGTSGNLTNNVRPTSALIPTSGTIASPTVFSASNCNRWGFAINNKQDNRYLGVPSGWGNAYSVQNNIATTDSGNTQTYAAVPTTNTVIKNTTSDTPGFSDTTNLYFAACAGGAGGNPATGKYQAKVTLTATANVLDDYVDDNVIVDMDPNLIPIYFSDPPGEGAANPEEPPKIYKADITNKNQNWYSYSQKKWANAATIKADKLPAYKQAPIGSEISNDDVMGYFVYIPRYQYQTQTLSYSTTNYPKAFRIQLQTVEDTKSRREDVRKAGDWVTPPAFTFGSKELNGIWVAKHEAGQDTENITNTLDYNVTFKPDQASRRGQNVSNQLKSSLGLITTHNLSTTTTGFPSNTETTNYGLMDSHMMNGDAWGATAMFSQSLYGVCTNANCTIDNTAATGRANAKAQKVWNNAYSNANTTAVANGGTGSKRTGCGRYNGGDSYLDNNSPEYTSGAAPCVQWYTAEGQLSSTTNSVEGTSTGIGGLKTPAGTRNHAYYGLYDLAGGAFEYTLANYNCVPGTSGFTQAELGTTGSPCNPSTGAYTKYITTYLAPPLTGSNDVTGGRHNFTPGSPNTYHSLTNALQETGGWNSDYTAGTTSSNPWFQRGGNARNEELAGVFDSNAYTGGPSTTSLGYRTVLTHTDQAQPEQPAAGAIQSFSLLQCAAMQPGETKKLYDERDKKEYRVRKMPDEKCWMMDNLAYAGGTANGGTNYFGDEHALTFATATDTSSWTTSTGITTRYVTTNNYTGSDQNSAGGQLIQNTTGTLYSGTQCTNSVTGNPPMDSKCLSYLYNFCSAAGLDSTTTPTCAAAVNTGSGTGYATNGVIGKQGGKGGESKGNTNAGNPSNVNSTTNGTICPAGWRLPQGRDNSSGTNDTNNEWAILNGSMNTGTLSATNTGTGSGYYQNWQPNATTGGNDAWRSSFGTVSSGYFGPGNGLGNQSTYAYWWSSSLYSSTYAYRAYVRSSAVSPGTSYSVKYSGFAVRCAFP